MPPENDPNQNPDNNQLPPDNTPDTPSGGDTDTGAGEEFDLVAAVDAAYEQMDEHGNVKPDDGAGAKDEGESKPEGEQAGEKPGDTEPGAGEGAGTGEADKDKAGEGDKPDADEPPLELTEEDKKLFNERGRERVQSLIDRVKSTSTEREQLAAERDQYRDSFESVSSVLRETGADTQTLADVLDLTTELVSGDPRRGERAVQRAHDWIKGYARQYGVSLPQSSVLDAFPDLQQQVESGHITQEVAEEHARLRSQQATLNHQRQAETVADNQRQQYLQAAQQAEQDLRSMLGEWQAKDADFERKGPLMEDYAKQLAQGIVNGQIHPRSVAPLLKDRYDTITRTMETVSTAMRDNGRNEPNPVRQGGARAPSNTPPAYSSVAEAIEGETRR